MRKLLLIVSVFAIVSVHGVAAAEGIAVIVNKENKNILDRDLINKIFLGTVTKWKSGGNIKLIEPHESDSTNETFAKKVMGRSQQSLREHWSVLFFTGKAIPPTQVTSDEEVARIVASNKNAIGYINAGKMDDNVRVVYIVK